jgi:outer membrane protein TolC
MERFNRLSIVLTVLLLTRLGPLPCHAQSPAPPPTAPPSAPAAGPDIPAQPGIGQDARVAMPVPQSPNNAEQDIPPPRPTTSPSDAAPPRGAAERTPVPIKLELPARPSQKSSLEQPPPPGGETVKLDLPPLEPGDLRFPINLGTALRLADARPLVVAAAQASAWVAEAQLQKAKVLWVPDFNLGFVYYRHDGPGPDVVNGLNIPSGENLFGQDSTGSFGKPLSQNINYFYTGGAFFQMRNMTDMIFEPLRARQNLNAARFDIQSAKNNALLMTARAYFEVHKFRGQYAGMIDTVRRGRKLVAAIASLSTDLIHPVEIDRARNFLANVEQHAVLARQYWRRSSANLTQVLRLDPRAVVEPLEPDHMQITLIDPSRSLDDLIPIALTNRPELASHQAQIQAALARIRQEKMRPFLPVAMLQGFQTPYEQLEFGAIGIGNGGKMNLWSYRQDISPQLLWQADALGLGNMAMVKWRRGEASQATVELFKAQDMVAADVVRAQARLHSAAARTVQSERELRGAISNFDGVLEGLQQTQRFGNVLKLISRPQEAVFAHQLLMIAYNNYYATVAQYNAAQFELFHALGYPARDIEFLRPPDGLVPVDTTRPTWLPPVGTGPPPPSR